MQNEARIPDSTPKHIDRDSYLIAANIMARIGGSFASRIGEAFFYADSDNTQRLLSAFPELFERYARIAADLEKMESEHD